MRLKDFFLILMVGMLCLVTLSACDTKGGMTDDDYNKCKLIVEVYDAYLDMTIDNETAAEKIENIGNDLDDESKYNLFSIYAGYLSVFDDPAEALDNRNDIAESIGLPKR